MVVRYHGDVQGVGFRATAVQQAAGLRIDGFVRNEADGSVLMDAQGPPADVKELLRRIQAQMGHHIGESLIDRRDPLDDRQGFSIRY